MDYCHGLNPYCGTLFMRLLLTLSLAISTISGSCQGYSFPNISEPDAHWNILQAGVAYYWGNACYPDGEGRMIPLDRLKIDLREYLATHLC